MLKFTCVLYLFTFALALPFTACAQKNTADTGLEKNLQKHVLFLASDALGGRLTGTKGEAKAADYIRKQFREAGLTPAGEGNSYYQPFTFYKSFTYGKNNLLKVGNTKFELEKDYYPIPYSAEGKTKAEMVDVGFGITDPQQKYDDYSQRSNLEGKIFLVNLSLPDGVHPHSKFLAFKSWRSRYEIAKQYKPAGIIFYNSEQPLNIEAYSKFNNLQREEMILLHVTEPTIKHILTNPGLQAEIRVNLERKQASGKNVVGFIDNGQPKTVVIGAHYDHLGHGEYGNSLHRGKPSVHNGADDNASGTAALIELARLIKQAGLKQSNYLFIAFSGEELGLLGSNYFTKNPTIPIENISYMINMDMVGRLDTATKELGINGTGTAPVWDSLIQQTAGDKFKIKTSASGMGPSDHSSFYLRNIPAIHLFTGTHSDYHKPSDDEEKLNYDGLAAVTDFIFDITKKLDDQPKLAFQKTKEDKVNAPAFKVTLGIIPDYFYDKEGIRVDGVSEDKPAQKAGIQAGDIIVKMGEHQVRDMNGYMTALSKFNKGDSTTVEVIRGEKKLSFNVQFK